MPAQSGGRLAGRKILVVEDSYLIAEDVCITLAREGCEIVGPASHLAAGLKLAEAALLPDCALLDINLHGEHCFPIARMLAGRAVPYIFLTGYDDRAIIPPDVHPVAVLGKPLGSNLIEEVLRALTHGDRAGSVRG